MTTLTTETHTSFTGKILYSDCYVRIPRAPGSSDDDTSIKGDVPFLNQWAGVLLIGSLAGVTRCALAVIHILGHTLAAVIFWNSGHLCHVIKGVAEFIRGAIEMIPIAGNIFVWLHDAPGYERFLCLRMPHDKPQIRWSFFMIKIKNPWLPDNIDYAIRCEEVLRKRDSGRQCYEPMLF